MQTGLPTEYQSFIHLSRYSRWLEEKGRRETWEETVTRYFDFFAEYLKEKFKFDLSPKLRQELQSSVLELKVMPSMRALMTAGEALKKNHIASFNCAYLPVDTVKSFAEVMYILMNGTGVGFSVETASTKKLPEVAPEFHKTDSTIVVPDSKLGWSKSFLELLQLLYAGLIPNIDYSRIRPAGARLKTFGGRASGHESLKDLFDFTVNVFKKSAGRKLSSLECHDIVCKTASIVICGGVRRCLLGTDEVLVSGGMKKIKDIKVGDLVQTDIGLRKVLATEKIGRREVSEIKTNLVNLYSTKEHRWAVLLDTKGNYRWTETKDLQEGDRLIFNTDSIGGEYQDFPESTSDFKMPTLDSDMAWFIGYFQGNGSVSIRYRNEEKTFHDYKVRVSFPTNLPEIENKVVEQFSKIFPKFGIHDKETSKEITISRSDPAKYFLEHIKQPNTPIEIPEFIRNNTEEIRCAYLAGLLDSDGSVRNKVTDGVGSGVFTIVSSKYESFIRSVHSLVASLGVPSVIFKKEREGKSDENGLKPVNSYFVKKLYLKLKDFSVKLTHDYFLEEENAKDISGLSFLREHLSCEEKSVMKHNNIIGIHKYIKEMGHIKVAPVTVNSVEVFGYNEVYDIQVEERECFYVNGILTHNSALISLSDLNDVKMREAKSGQWWVDNVQRALANNSAVYESKPDITIFMDEWISLVKSGSGERGIFNRDATKKQVAKVERRKENNGWGCNPCSEIILRPYEFCNLSEVVVRSGDSEEILKEKIRVASILGTFQSTLTDFKFINSKWKENCDEERLLGVSLTGVMDHEVLSGKKGFKKLEELLISMKQVAIDTNKEYAELLGIPQSTSVTCTKPSGTISQLVDSASGIHTRHAPYYIRTVRADNKDPLCIFMKNNNFPWEPCANSPDHVTVFSFPMKSPKNSIFRDDLSAIEQLEIWLAYQRHWCEHKPSVTISVREKEWLDVGAWVYKNFDEMTGVSFLPHSEHVYKQAPYQDCTKEEYEAFVEKMPKNVDWSKLSDYEKEDNTVGSQTMACSGNSCEIVDLTK